MSANGTDRFLNIEDANLRVRSGNVHAKGITVGGITVGASHGLQRVSDVSNTTSNTLQFTNATTSFKATSNIEIGGDVSYTSKPKISVDSNVVTEYTGPHDRPLRKYPEVALTQNDESATSGYVASRSSVSGSYDAWNTFSAYTSNANRWQSTGNTYDSSGNWVSGVGATGVQFTDTASGQHSGEWIKIQLPKSIKLDYIRYLCNYTTFMTKDFVILGSNDDTSWTLLKSVTGGTSIEDVYHTLHINAGGYYKYYVWLTTAINGNSGEVVFNDICFYGHEEGSGSLDTTLKSVYNVPATTGTQLEVYYDGRDYTSGSTITDKVGNADATISSGSDITFDSTYKAWVFGGSTSRTQTIKTGTLPTSLTGGANAKPEISVALWFNPTVWGDDTLFMIANPAFDQTDNQFLEVRINGNQDWRIQVWDGQHAGHYSVPGFSESSYDMPVNNWYHFAVSISGKTSPSTERKVYVNGIECTFKSQDYTPSGVLNLPVDSQLQLGKRPTNGSGADATDVGGKHFFGSIANFRLYSKALNAGQVQELYDYQKDYFLGSKSQVTLYKGHLGVGVTEPSGQLELAGDERIQEYPPRGMTHSDGTATGSQTARLTKNITYIEGHGEFKASASRWSVGTVGYDGQQPYNAFDKGTYGWVHYENAGYNNTTGAYEDNEYNLSASSGTPYGHWLKLEMPYTINIKSYFLDGSGQNYSPHDWQIWASNDDNSWTHIHSYSGETYDDSNGRYYTVSHTGHYKMFAIIVTSIHPGATLNGSATDRIWIKEMKYFGTPGPTTLDKGSLSLTRSLDVPRVSRYDVDTETPRPEKLVVDFDTTVNSSPTDISGKGNHGTFYNGAYYSAADKAFNFDGSQYIQGDTGLTGNFVHSISMWFNASNDGQLFWTGINSSSGDRLNIFFSEDGGYGGNTTTPQIHYTFKGHTHYVNVNPDQWYHLVCTYSGTNSSSRKIYIDGVPVGSDTATDGTGDTTHALNIQTSTFYLNKTNYGNSSLIGSISNFKLYNVALEPSEVKKLYNLGRTGRSMVISDTAVGIGKVPEAQLDVRGNLKVSGGIYTGMNYAVFVWLNGFATLSAGNKIPFDTAVYNPLGLWNTSTYQYTCPVNGVYMCTATLLTGDNSYNANHEWYLNDSSYSPRLRGHGSSSATSYKDASSSVILLLNRGDRLDVRNASAGEWYGSTGYTHTSANIHLLYPI